MNSEIQPSKFRLPPNILMHISKVIADSSHSLCTENIVGIVNFQFHLIPKQLTVGF